MKFLLQTRYIDVDSIMQYDSVSDANNLFYTPSRYVAGGYWQILSSYQTWVSYKEIIFEIHSFIIANLILIFKNIISGLIIFIFSNSEDGRKQYRLHLLVI